MDNKNLEVNELNTEAYKVVDLWGLPDISSVIPDVCFDNPKAIIIQKKEHMTERDDYKLIFVGSAEDCEAALELLKKEDKLSETSIHGTKGIFKAVAPWDNEYSKEGSFGYDQKEKCQILKKKPTIKAPKSFERGV